MKTAINTLATTLVLLFAAFYSTKGQENYGLTFYSFNAPQEKRTSLELFQKDFCFDDSMDLSFDFSFIPNRSIYFGYLFRMISNNGQNIDLVYNQKDEVFNTIVGESFCGIDFKLDKTTLYNKWTRIRYHLTKTSISCYINGQLYKTAPVTLRDNCFHIVFGALRHKDFITTDVPPMMLRNVGVAAGDKLRYYWPLGKPGTNPLEDSIAHKTAFVTFPLWSDDLHRSWRLLKSLNVKGNASVTFNQEAEEIYLVSEDTVYRLPANDEMTTEVARPSLGYHLFQANQSLYNSVDNKLYNFYIDLKSIATWQDNSFRWTRTYDTVANTEYGHTSKVFSRKENALYIFGGYGQLKYKNQVQRYDFNTQQWLDLQPSGDYFTPRYMSAAGQWNDSIYILGGYGSHTGDQVLRPQHLYDFMRFDTRTKTFKKRFTIKNSGTPFVFASSIIIDTLEQAYYVLCYDESRYDTRLKMIKGSLFSPEYEFVGDEIPYVFQDVISDADLFYCPRSRQLLAVTLLTELGKQTSVKIYSIGFPPLPALAADKAHSLAFSWWWLIVLLIPLGGIVWWIRKQRNRTVIATTTAPPPAVLSAEAPAVPAATTPVQPRPVAEPIQERNVTEEPPYVLNRSKGIRIYLFGNFEILDADGTTYNNQFSPLLKELFLVILLYTIKNAKGISSEKLNDIFWGDKAGKNAKNNLSVNIVRLKGILAKIGEISIKKDNERWMLDYDPALVSIDLMDFMAVKAVYQGHGRQKLAWQLFFVSRGSFLKQTEYAWLDDLKSDYTNKIIDELLEESSHLHPQQDADILVETASCIFNFDPLSEEALRLKCHSLIAMGRHSLAKNAYERFIKDYHKVYGEEYPIAFSEIVK
ncbi:kelch repeat-containing protein [Chitinophaga sp. Hz27]|uniref:Kelch repeat-containing protein n=1 Tax=Chitinophaga sp. Hz27 TaxID=3347169 RepID=UPI0035E0E9CA